MKKTLSIICAAGLDNFLAWAPRLKDEYDVRVFAVRTVDEIEAALLWGDILWYEWCNEVAVAGTQRQYFGSGFDKVTNTVYGRIHKPTIVRLHSYEAFTDMPNKVSWEEVNALVYVAPHIREIAERYNHVLKSISANVVEIPNGVDVDAIPNLNPGPGRNIAVVGGISHKKAPEMVLQIMDSLVTNHGGDYYLHWAGEFQDPRYEVYLRHMVKVLKLENRVTFYGHVVDMEKYWLGKNYLLHTSIHEGHSYAIMEAMARNIRPIIHNYYGAEEQYPSWTRFLTVGEAADMVLAPDRVSLEYSYRNSVIAMGWTLDDQVEQIRHLLGRVAA